MALIRFFSRARLKAVKQVVGFDALALAAADFDVRLLRVLGGNFVAEFLCAARSERDDVVRKVLQIVSLLRMTERAKARDDDLLRIRLPRINHVEDLARVAECGCVRVTRDAAGYPDLASVPLLVERFVVEIAREETKLP